MNNKLSTPVKLSPESIDALKQAAMERTGFDDFGPDDDYMPGLYQLLKAIDSDLLIASGSREMLFNLLVDPLVARLYACEGWKRRFDCLSKPIVAPVIIVGLPRTGTTALHRLLSFDPQFQGPELWLIDSPMPRPPRNQWNDFAEYQRCHLMTEAMNAASPKWNVYHPRGPNLVDECLDITKQCFNDNVWGSYFPVPSYDAWWPKQDHAGQYDYLKMVLQLIGADDGRPWLLKDPTSIMYLTLLMSTFPDARLIFTHRDPVKSIPSTCSLIATAQKLVLGEKIDYKTIGSRNSTVWAKGANLLAETDMSNISHVHVYMEDFQADHMATVEKIYNHFGLQLSEEAVKAMRAEIVREKSIPRSKHVCTLEEFGLDENSIRTLFAPYIERFHFS